MKRQPRSIALPAALAVAGLLASSSPAAAHGGSHWGLRSPRAAPAFGVGSPAFRPGFIVPWPHRLFFRAHFGHGFQGLARFCAFHGMRHAHWAPVRRFRTGWIVVPQRFPGHGHHRHFHRRY